MPVNPRIAGDVRFEDIDEILWPVLTISPTPDRDKIIAVESAAPIVTVAAGQANLIYTTDLVPPGEIHRYTVVNSFVTGGGVYRCTVVVQSGTSNPAITVDSLLVLKGCANGTLTNLFAHTGFLTVGPIRDLVSSEAPSGIPFDIYPGGRLVVTQTNLAVADVGTLILQRVRLHGPLQGFDNVFSNAITIAQTP